MESRNMTVNYNGEPLKADEVLVFMPYDEVDVRENVTNWENVMTITKAGRKVKTVRKAVPQEYAAAAKAQFNCWQREQLPTTKKGRCLIPQSDGTYKECPKKRGNNRVSCYECPKRGMYERKDNTPISIDEQRDKHNWSLAISHGADARVLAEEELEQARRRFVDMIEAVMEKSPKHGLAIILMGMGYKGAEFAERMHLKHDAASRICSQIRSAAPDRISDFSEFDVHNLKVNKSGDSNFYRREAYKALDVLLEMRF